MSITISSLNKEVTFDGKDVINIGTNQDCDYIIEANFDLLLTIYYSISENKFTILNPFANENVLFMGKTIGQKIEGVKICKLMVANSDEFISIKITNQTSEQKIDEKLQLSDFLEADIKNIYGDCVNSSVKVKIKKCKDEIDQRRTTIIKQVSYKINDLKNKISNNFKINLFLHIALFVSALISSFAVANYLMGLKIQETENFLSLPTNIKVLLMFSVLIYGICLLLKQGIYLFLQNKIQKEVSSTSKIAEKFMLFISTVFIVSVYVINLIYYTNLDSVFVLVVLISLFFVGIMTTLAIGCGYFKSNSAELLIDLNKNEYREDFESVMKDYQNWIELFVNNLSKTRLNNIKNKLFSLQLKTIFEVIIGILTAPFLAYGVSNTLAMCFPEAAGWVRISGFRFSPVFLVLATFLIIFAFFAFVNAFFCARKVQASNVIKQDGFSNYLHNGVDIYGLEGVKKINSEKVFSLVIAIAIIFIEFSMNISYFMSEIGGDLQGLFLSLIAALVPTALLIAETYMLSQTKFQTYAAEELISLIDKD